jgi:hypothetical protein
MTIFDDELGDDVSSPFCLNPELFKKKKSPFPFFPPTFFLE